jgi:hydroxymethylglutaryl-CoA lyase
MKHSINPPTLVECPRDSWQGFSRFIPTSEKISYLKLLIDAGFTHLDFGSYVSPQAVPQMKDTEEVWAAIRAYRPGISFIAIVANERGLDRALAAGGSPAIGYPFSISDTFQKNNTGKTITESWPVLTALQRRANVAKLELHVYLSMGFGNPYGEPWSVAWVTDTLAQFRDLGIQTVILADTVGCAAPEQIREVFAASGKRLPAFPLGAHFHASPANWRANVEAALDAGCARLDSALGGIGGCPFAQDALVGNVPTEGVLSLLNSKIDVSAVLPEAQRLQRDYQ